MTSVDPATPTASTTPPEPLGKHAVAKPTAKEVAGRTFAALQFRNFRLWLISQVVSFSGTWMQTLAQSWLVLELTGSGTKLGTVLAFQFVPTLLLSPIGGTITDRFDKRRLIMLTQSVAGLAALTLGVLTLSGVIELWMVYCVAAVFGLVAAFDNPTRQVFVMEMVGPEMVPNAVMLNSVSIHSARILGPAMGGLLIAFLSTGWCFMVNGFSYLAIIATVVFIDKSKLHPVPRAPRGKGMLRQGVKYAWTSNELRTTLIVMWVVGIFMFEFTVTLPLLAKNTFHIGSGGLAALESLMGVGAVCGGLVQATLGRPTTRRVVGLCAVFSVLILAVAYSPNEWFAYAFTFVMGAFSVSTVTCCNTTLQLNSKPELRGRVMALFSMALIGSTPIGGPIVGWIGEHVSPRAGLGIGGIAGLLVAAWSYTQYRKDWDDGERLPTLDLEPAAAVAGH